MSSSRAGSSSGLRPAGRARLFRACIHRGAQQIGGSCIELECRGNRLVLDLGRPLEGALEDDAPLPPIAGLDGSDPSLRGVIISHGHPDHYGLAGQLPPSVPVFVGDATARILKEALFFTGAGLAVQPAGRLTDREPFTIGPFRVTPYLVDHSAFDAYAFRVQADGRTIFYSGDLRAHGRKASLMERLINDPPAADVLILEGTRIDERGAGQRGAASERDVEEQALAVLRQAPGIALVFYSPQNIDRLVSLYRAAKRAGRVFVLDLYAAAIAFASGRATIPQAHWSDVRVFVPQSQRVRVKETGEFHRTAALGSSRIFPEQLREQRGKLVLTCRGSMLSELERTGCLNESARALWSIWPGYLEQPEGVRLRERLDGLGVPLTIAHASGHATVADLTRLVSAMRPERVVPIHTASPERFLDAFDRAELRADGEWWDV
jgi:ribonuclease J